MRVAPKVGGTRADEAGTNVPPQNADRRRARGQAAEGVSRVGGAPARPIAFGTGARPSASGHHSSRTGSMSEQTYDEGRRRNLEALLLALADRIRELHAEGTLLQHASELTRLIGDVRSELFHYEVRATYDTPEIAENRRIVSEAKKNDEANWEPNEWKPDEEDDPEW